MPDSKSMNIAPHERSKVTREQGVADESQCLGNSSQAILIRACVKIHTPPQKNTACFRKGRRNHMLPCISLQETFEGKIASCC